MAYAAWSVVFGEQPSAAKWNILGTNDASFNDGTGIADAAITPAKRSGGFAKGTLVVSSTGAKSVTGLSFQPKFLRFYGTVTTSDVVAFTSTGSFDGTSLTCFTTAYSAANDGASRYYTDRMAIITLNASAAATFVRVDNVAFTSDGFTYTVVTADSGGTIEYEAYG